MKSMAEDDDTKQGVYHTKHGGVAEGRSAILAIFSFALALDFILGFPSKRGASKTID